MELIPTVDPFVVKPTRFSNYGDHALFVALFELARELARRQPDIKKEDVLFQFKHDYEFETYIYSYASQEIVSDPNEVPFL